MRERIIEIEADSLKEARRLLLDNENILVLEITILNRERVGTIESTADTVAKALAAIRGIPAKAEIRPHEVKTDARRVAIKAHGDNEESVGKEIKPKKAEVIESIRLHKKGRNGFLGFFKRLNLYEVVLFQQAVVEVTFYEKARLRARVRDYLARDLLECIEELRGRNASWKEAVQALNPRKDGRALTWLERLRESESFGLPNPFELIENACRRNPPANWETPIEEAYRKVVSAESRLWQELRGLDVEIADKFNLYTSILWFAKKGDPTGIPTHTRPRWGLQSPDERFREKIPRYSTDRGAFADVERKLEVIAGLRELYEQCLKEGGLKESTAPQRKKCASILEARLRQLRGRGNDSNYR
jgi:hypothetical protein